MHELNHFPGKKRWEPSRCPKIRHKQQNADRELTFLAGLEKEKSGLKGGMDVILDKEELEL